MAKTPYQRPIPPTHSRIPKDELHAGKLYRVRDRDTPAALGHVWGENLPHDQAEKLKNTVTGKRQSRTARIEDMEIPRPRDPQRIAAAAKMAARPPVARPVAPKPLVVRPQQPHTRVDPQLAAMQSPARAAAAKAAAEANARHAEASALHAAQQPVSEEEEEGEIDPEAVGDLLDDLGGVSEEEISQAEAQAEAPEAEAT